MKKRYVYIPILLLPVLFWLTPERTSAQSAAEPVVRTEQTPYGQTMTVSFPSGYSGSVTSTFDGTNWKTTTKKYSKTDIAALQKKVADQQKAMQQLFETQQQLMRQLFQRAWPGWM